MPAIRSAEGLRVWGTTADAGNRPYHPIATSDGRLRRAFRTCTALCSTHRLPPFTADQHLKERTVVPAETHVEQGPMDRQEVLDLIRDRLSDILEIDPKGINEGDSFADDLEADSLALIELVEALEEELGERSVGFRIEDEDLEDLKTVRDAVDYVVAKMG